MTIIQLSFLDGKVCRYCNEFKTFSEIRPQRNECLSCAAKRTRQWRLDHPEHKIKKNEQQKRSREKHAEKYKAKRREQRQKAYYADIDASREKAAKHQREWREKNPVWVRAKTAERRARKRLSPGMPSFTAQEWIDLCEKYDNRCLKCGKHLRLSPDHVIPISKDGSGTIDNIQPLCVYCNMDKGQRIEDYRPPN